MGELRIVINVAADGSSHQLGEQPQPFPTRPARYHADRKRTRVLVDGCGCQEQELVRNDVAELPNLVLERKEATGLGYDALE